MSKKNDSICAFLGKETEFDGKLILTGSVRIEGTVKGEILGSGTLIVGESAVIEADIAVDNIVIYGMVKGNLEIREKVDICSSGKLWGTMRTSVLAVQEGALFEGQCNMGTEGLTKTESGAKKA